MALPAIAAMTSVGVDHCDETRSGAGGIKLKSLDRAGQDDDDLFTYDNCSNGAGRLCRIADAAETVDFEYDALGRIVKVGSNIKALFPRLLAWYRQVLVAAMAPTLTRR